MCTRPPVRQRSSFDALLSYLSFPTVFCCHMMLFSDSRLILQFVFMTLFPAIFYVMTLISNDLCCNHHVQPSLSWWYSFPTIALSWLSYLTVLVRGLSLEGGGNPAWPVERVLQYVDSRDNVIVWVALSWLEWDSTVAARVGSVLCLWRGLCRGCDGTVACLCYLSVTHSPFAHVVTLTLHACDLYATSD